MKTSMFGLLSHIEVNVMKKILEQSKNHQIMPVLKWLWDYNFFFFQQIAFVLVWQIPICAIYKHRHIGKVWAAAEFEVYISNCQSYFPSEKKK